MLLRLFKLIQCRHVSYIGHGDRNRRCCTLQTTITLANIHLANTVVMNASPTLLAMSDDDYISTAVAPTLEDMEFRL